MPSVRIAKNNASMAVDTNKPSTKGYARGHQLGLKLGRFFGHSLNASESAVTETKDFVRGITDAVPEAYAQVRKETGR